jgi:hypothetical protein
MDSAALNDTAQDLIDKGLDVRNMDYNEMFPGVLTAKESQDREIWVATLSPIPFLM